LKCLSLSKSDHKTRPITLNQSPRHQVQHLGVLNLLVPIQKKSELSVNFRSAAIHIHIQLSFPARKTHSIIVHLLRGRALNLNNPLHPCLSSDLTSGCHVMNVVCKSKSDIRGDLWVLRAIETENDSTNKVLFSEATGEQEKGGIYEDYMFKLLEKVQSRHPEHIPADLEVRETYSISRSCRRGANSEAQNAPNEHCEEKDINRNNCWRAVDRAKMKKASMDMLQLYTDTRLC